MTTACFAGAMIRSCTTRAQSKLMPEASTAREAGGLFSTAVARCRRTEVRGARIADRSIRRDHSDGASLPTAANTGPV